MMLFKKFTRTKLNTKFVQVLLCSLFFAFFIGGKCSAGSYVGSGSQWRLRINNLEATSSVSVSSSINPGTQSPWILGVEYVMGIDAGNSATKVSGHAKVPIFANSSQGTDWYLRPACNSSTIHVGVTSSGFYSYNASNLTISNCQQHYAESAVAGSTSGSAYAWEMEFDFTADIPSISGNANVSIGFYPSSVNDLIMQVKGTSATYYFTTRSPLDARFYYNDAVMSYYPSFSVSVASNQSDLIAQQQVAELQRLQQAQQETADAIKNQTEQQHADSQAQLEEMQKQNDWLTSTDEPDVDTSSLGDTAGWLPAGPVDSLLTLPITFLQGVANAFNSSDNCSPIKLPLPFVDKSIELPCMRPIFNEMGITPVWETVGGIISLFLLWETFKWLYKFVDDTLTMRENSYYNHFWGGL